MDKVIKNKENAVLAIHKKVINLKNEVGKRLYKMGAYLKLIRDKELYKELGYETFNEYIAQPELQFQRSMVYSLIGVYIDFIENEKFQSSDIEKIPYYSLDRIRQFKNDENIKEWICKARELSLSDLSAEIRIAKGESESVVNEEVYVQEKKVYQVTCPKCGCQFEHLI